MVRRQSSRLVDRRNVQYRLGQPGRRLQSGLMNQPNELGFLSKQEVWNVANEIVSNLNHTHEFQNDGRPFRLDEVGVMVAGNFVPLSRQALRFIASRVLIGGLSNSRYVDALTELQEALENRLD